MRVAITGPPRSGKTTLAREYTRRAYHTDDLIGLGWSEASRVASLWFDAPGQLVVEGVAVPRALRKWLARTEAAKPVDRLIVLTRPRERLTPGQDRMAKAINTVLAEILPGLEARGVEVEYR